MPSYDIQFQKCLSLWEFIARFGTEDQCIDAIYKARWPRGFECPSCGPRRRCRLSSGLFQCQGCRKQTSPTAGMIFQGTKILTHGWKSFNFLEVAGFKHEPHAMPQPLLKMAWMAHGSVQA